MPFVTDFLNWISRDQDEDERYEDEEGDDDDDDEEERPSKPQGEL